MSWMDTIHLSVELCIFFTLAKIVSGACLYLAQPNVPAAAAACRFVCISYIPPRAQKIFPKLALSLVTSFLAP